MPMPHHILLTIILLFSSLATAQTTTYRWVDPATGQTVYSDHPPPPGARLVVTKTAEERSSDEPQLPYATRQAVEKFPVTFYSAANCVEACNKARALLNGRGIPFTEKMLKSEEETAELARILGSEATVPSLTVGQQNFKGFESNAWNNLLDLAGYPKSAPYGAKASGTFAK